MEDFHLLSPYTGLELQTLAYQSLLDVSKTILQHRDLAGLFRELYTLLSSVLRFDFLNLVLHDPRTNTMRLHILESTVGPAAQAPPNWELAPEESPSGWVFLHQEPLVIADVSAETRWPAVMELLRRNNIATSCWLPLTTAQHRLGALVFGFGPTNLAEKKIEFMQQVAAQVAVAVDNTLNIEKVEKYQRQLALERDRLQVLLEITNTLVSELDIRDLFPSITSCVRRAVPHEYASLALRVPATDQLRIHALVFAGAGEVLQEGATASLSETPAGEAMETRRPVVLDSESLARYASPVVQRLGASGLKTICAIPLITRLHVLGTLNVGSTRANAFR